MIELLKFLVWSVPGVMLVIVFLIGFTVLIESVVDKAIERARVDVIFKNDMLSWFYFIIEMGPNVSATSVVAIFIGGIDTVLQLIGVFLAGVLMKHYGRRARDLFMDVVRAGETTWK